MPQYPRNHEQRVLVHKINKKYYVIRPMVEMPQLWPMISFKPMMRGLYLQEA